MEPSQPQGAPAQAQFPYNHRERSRRVGVLAGDAAGHPLGRSGSDHIDKLDRGFLSACVTDRSPMQHCNSAKTPKDWSLLSRTMKINIILLATIDLDGIPGFSGDRSCML